MQSNFRAISHSRSTQRGVSLAISLIFLLLLALAGVSAMQSGIYEIKMAGASLQQSVALNAAEETLVTAEQQIEGIVNTVGAFDFSSGGDGYYTAVDTIDLFDISWAGLSAESGPGVQDRFVTEFLGEKPIPGETIKVLPGGGTSGGFIYTFRVTSRSQASKNAVRLVQTLYITNKSP